MWVLPLIGYLGVIVGFCFLTLAIASGLYYLSELVEEHTVLASRVLSRLIQAIILLHILLWLIDGLPFSLTLLSIVSHLVYASNLRRFPIVKLSDPLFILSCLLVGLNHWLWFRHFSDPTTSQTNYNRTSSSSMPFSSHGQYYGASVDLPSFTEVASYFGLCSGYTPGNASSEGRSKSKGMAKALVDGVRDWVSETGELMGAWGGQKSRRF
ncbi:conserved hypothetical protein [Uncinocarpus reesii 1704]|uniref:Uncharacterized protein n=1 Tax=Uncinocarpus reesii (strain UAMH 1704) TaxID=336963 RepID=C4K077_UNCRE|nr:uncharacterized protein UREG_07828 [Uncinocarpus reesii 1704]EEP82963.1 conserved hypothetical protein [Uncinocarpus reesii 1704]